MADYVRIPAEDYAALRAQSEQAEALSLRNKQLETQLAQYELLLEASQTYAKKEYTTEEQSPPPTASSPQAQIPTTTQEQPTTHLPTNQGPAARSLSEAAPCAPGSNEPPKPTTLPEGTLANILESTIPEPAIPQSPTNGQPAANEHKPIPSNGNGFDLDLRAALAGPGDNKSAQPVAPPKPKSHLDTEEYVKSPVPYKEIFTLALQYIYPQSEGGPPADLILTPRKVNIIMNGIEMGLSRKGACALAGLSYREIQSTPKRRKEPYKTFLDLLDIAEARTEVRLVGAWQSQTHNNWQAAQALLAKRFQQEWGDRHIIELTAHQLQDLPDDEIRAIVGEEVYRNLLPPPPNTIDVTPYALTDEAQSTGQPTANTPPPTNRPNGVPEFDDSITYE